MTSGRDDTFTAHISGDELGERVSLDVFQEFLEDLKGTLGRVARLEAGQRDHCRFEIASLGDGSAYVGIAAVADNPSLGPRVVSRYQQALSDLQSGHTCPDGFEPEDLEAFGRLVARLGRGVGLVEFIFRDGPVQLTSALKAAVEDLLGSRLQAQGDLTGYLDAVNVHGRYAFTIYPQVGPRKVACRFAPELLPRVAEGLKRYVTVHGVLHHRTGQSHPHQVDVESIDVHPPQDHLPSLASIRGIAPNATGGMDSVVFLRQLRVEDDA